MAFKAYRPVASNHTHENLAFNVLYDILEANWAEREGALHLIGNVFVDGQEVDAIILKSNAIIVIDFKNYGGDLSFSENDSWKINGVTVKGGAKRNPFYQIRDNKFTLLRYLERQIKFTSNPNFGHIAGLCLFHQKINFNPQSIPHRIGSWFHVADMERAFRTIDAIVSTQICLSDFEIETIIGQLDVPRYFPDGKPTEVDFDPSNHYREFPELELNAEQTNAFASIKEWLINKNCPAFSLHGAYGSGKLKVLKKSIQEILTNKKTPILLAANAKVASRYTENGIENVNSIYSWLYSKTPSGERKGKQVYPVNRPDFEMSKSVIIIVDSHLLSDNLFEMETTVYGSGHILTDFLGTFKSLEENSVNVEGPKILLFGDPYQLKRSLGHNNLISCGVFQKREIDFTITEIKSQDRHEAAPSERLDFQKNLIDQINSGQFLNLPMCSNNKIKAITKGGKTDAIAETLVNWPKRASYLCAKNSTAQSVNNAVRKNYLNAAEIGGLVTGDIVEIYSPTYGRTNTELEFGSKEYIYSGQFVRVKSTSSKIETKSILLKGRESPTIVNFASAHIELENGSSFAIEYLPDFLKATRPEMSKDQSLALSIWARREADLKLNNEKVILDRLKKENQKNTQEYKEKNQSYKQRHIQAIFESRFTTVARLRYAYAMTVHKAQSYNPLPNIVLDGSSSHDTDNPATESYFRWLYTATTCTSDTIQILNYPNLSTFSKIDWNFDTKKIVPIICKKQLYYDKNRQPTKEESYLLGTVGFDNSHPNLVAILLVVNDLIRQSTWKIERIQQNNYEERYIFSNGNGQVSVGLNYNGKYDATFGKVTVIEGKPDLGSNIRAQLVTKPIFQSQDIQFAFSLFRDHLAEKKWTMISIKETNYKVIAVAETDIGKIDLDINIPSGSMASKKGLISSVKVRQADSSSVVDKFKADFDNG